MTPRRKKERMRKARRENEEKRGGRMEREEKEDRDKVERSREIDREG